MSNPPAFLAVAGIGEEQLRAYLSSQEPQVRADWQAFILREAPYAEVWRYLKIDDIVANWPRLEHRLGARREPWRLLLQGWRKDGRIP